MSNENHSTMGWILWCAILVCLIGTSYSHDWVGISLTATALAIVTGDLRDDGYNTAIKKVLEREQP